MDDFTLIIVCEEDSSLQENLEANLKFWDREFPKAEKIIACNDYLQVDVGNRINIRSQYNGIGDAIYNAVEKANHDRIVLTHCRLVVNPQAVNEGFMYDYCMLHDSQAIQMFDFANEDFLEKSDYNSIHDKGWPFLSPLIRKYPTFALSFDRTKINGIVFSQSLSNYRASVFGFIFDLIEAFGNINSLPHIAYLLFGDTIPVNSIDDDVSVALHIHRRPYELRYNGRYISLPLIMFENNMITHRGVSKKNWSNNRGVMKIDGLEGKYPFNFKNSKIVFQALSSFNMFQIGINDSGYHVVQSKGAGWNTYEVNISNMDDSEYIDFINNINFKCMDELQVREVAIACQ